MILRRLVTINFVLGGTIAFLAGAEMRLYNVFLLLLEMSAWKQRFERAALGIARDAQSPVEFSSR